jgi:hypothetical protein
MEYSEVDHLKDKVKIVTDIYEKLIAELQKFGQLKIEPKKTSIHHWVTDLDLQEFIHVKTL